MIETRNEPRRGAATRRGDSRPARRRAQLPRVAAGGGAAHVDEQPGPGRGREARGADRLRRIGEGGAQLGVLRRDRGDPAALEGDRDAARAVGQAGGGLPDPRGRAASLDRQLPPRASLGHRRRVPAPRGSGADHVRSDDGRFVDLHRQPGHSPGHLRDLGRVRPAELRGEPRGHADRDGRSRRHGGGATAGGDDERRGLPGGRGRALAHRAPPGDALPRPRGRHSRGRHRSRRWRRGTPGRRCRSPWRPMPWTSSSA